jgi:hypothetical protein
MKSSEKANAVEHRGDISPDLLALMTEAAPADHRGSAGADRIPGVLLGKLAALSGTGTPMVAYDGGSREGPMPARSTVRLAAADVGRVAVLLFEAGDPTRPILVGLIEEDRPERKSRIEMEAGDERLVLEAPTEIVLRAGKSSITLTRAGKVLVRGEYVLSRSSGVNRIQGGSVQIN